MNKWYTSLTIIVAFIAIIFVMKQIPKEQETVYANTEININSQYKESPSTYRTNTIFEVIDEEIKQSEDIEVLPANYNGSYMVDSGVYKNYATAPTTQDFDIISLSENEMWSLLTDGGLTSYPTVTYGELKSIFSDAYMNICEFSFC